MTTSKIGTHHNLVVRTDFFDIAARLNEEHDLNKRISILDELNIADLPYIIIEDILKQFCGDKIELMNYMMKKNKNVFIQNLDPDLEYGYIHEYAERLKSQENNRVARDMVIALSDMYYDKLDYLRDTGMLEDDARLHCIAYSDYTSELYKDLVSIFKYDRKTIDCLNKIYPDFLSEYDDKELGSKVIINMLSEIINIDLNFFNIVKIFKNTILTLARDDWNDNDMSFLASESAYYIKRSIYGMVTVDEILNAVVFLSNEIESASTEKEYIILTGFMNYMNSIIEEAVGSLFKPPKDHSAYTVIPIDSLQRILDIMNSRDNNPFMDESEGLLFELESVAEVLHYYNKLNEGVESMSEIISNLNSSFISYIYKNNTDNNILKSNMKNTLSVLNWYSELITDNAMNIKATLQGLCILIMEGLEIFKKETIRTLNNYTSYKIISFNPNGFTTNFGNIDMYNFNDIKTKNIINMIGNADTITSKMFSASHPSSIKLLRALYGVAEILGSSYDNVAVKDFLKSKLFSKLDKTNFQKELFELLFGTDMVDTSFERIFSLENINTILEVPVLKNMDIGLLWEGYKLLETVQEVKEETIVDDKMTFELNDVDLDYNFDDLLIDESIQIWNLSPFQILRQMKYNKLNLLSTSSYEEFATYIIIYSILKTYEN